MDSDPFKGLSFAAQWVAVVVGFWGGLVANIGKFADHTIPLLDRILRLGMDLVVSSFASVMTYNLMQGLALWYKVSVPGEVLIGVAGISGHMGARTIVLLTNLLEGKLRGPLPLKKD